MGLVSTLTWHQGGGKGGGEQGWLGLSFPVSSLVSAATPGLPTPTCSGKAVWVTFLSLFPCWQWGPTGSWSHTPTWKQWACTSWCCRKLFMDIEGRATLPPHSPARVSVSHGPTSVGLLWVSSAWSWPYIPQPLYYASTVPLKKGKTRQNLGFSQHNVPYVQITMDNHAPDQETRKPQQEWEQAINRWQHGARSGVGSSGMDFTVAVIQRLQQTTVNSLETNEKVENLSNVKEVIRRRKMEIIELKNTLTEIKKPHWMGSRVE